MGGRHTTASGGHVQELGAGPVHLVLKPDDAGDVIAGIHHHGPGAAAKQNTGSPVGVVDDSGHRVGSDDQYLFMRSGRDEVSGCREAVDKARTGRDQVKTPSAAASEAVL